MYMWYWVNDSPLIQVSENALQFQNVSDSYLIKVEYFWFLNTLIFQGDSMFIFFMFVTWAFWSVVLLIEQRKDPDNEIISPLTLRYMASIRVYCIPVAIAL